MSVLTWMRKLLAGGWRSGPAGPAPEAAAQGADSHPAQPGAEHPAGPGAEHPAGPAPKPPPDFPSHRDPAVDLQVAEAVLAVADRLSTAELRRRLAAALALLPDIRLINPARGTKFDPAEHEWTGSVPADSPDQVGCIAETATAGLADHAGVLLRAARVVVYDSVAGHS